MQPDDSGFHRNADGRFRLLERGFLSRILDPFNWSLRWPPSPHLHTLAAGTPPVSGSELGSPSLCVSLPGAFFSPFYFFFLWPKIASHICSRWRSQSPCSSALSSRSAWSYLPGDRTHRYSPGVGYLVEAMIPPNVCCWDHVGLKESVVCICVCALVGQRSRCVADGDQVHFCP